MDSRYLFRGKRLDNGEWVKGNYHYNPKTAEFPHIHEHSIFPHNSTPVSVSELGVDPTTIGQSSGLYAAKSYRGESEDARLIFEGDIVRYAGTEEIVFWHTGNGSWGVISKGMYPDRCSGEVRTNGTPLCQAVYFKCEIIGTIHT